MPPQTKRKTPTPRNAPPTAAQAKAARRAQSEKGILAYEKKAQAEATKAAAAAAASAKKIAELRAAQRAEDDANSSKEESAPDREAQQRSSASQRFVNDELAQRVADQAEDAE